MDEKRFIPYSKYVHALSDKIDSKKLGEDTEQSPATERPLNSVFARDIKISEYAETNEGSPAPRLDFDGFTDG